MVNVTTSLDRLLNRVLRPGVFPWGMRTVAAQALHTVVILSLLNPPPPFLASSAAQPPVGRPAQPSVPAGVPAPAESLSQPETIPQTPVSQTGAAPASAEDVLYVANSSQIGRTRNFSGPSPNWVSITGVISGTIHDFALDPFDPYNQAWVVGTTGVWKTTNLDADAPVWTQLLSVQAISDSVGLHDQIFGVARLLSSPVRRGYFLIAVWDANPLGGNDQGGWLGRTFDSGATWQWSQLPSDDTWYGQPNHSEIGPQVAALDMADDGSGRIWLGLANDSGRPRIHFSSDWGATWVYLTGIPRNWTQPRSLYIPEANPAVIYMTQGISLTQSSDGGTTWVDITPPGAEASTKPRGLTGVPLLPGDLFLVSQATSRGPVYHSGDGGASFPITFTTPLTLTPNLYAGNNSVVAGLSAYDPDRLAALALPRCSGTHCRIQQTAIGFSSDGGLTWSNRSGDWHTVFGSWEGATGSSAAHGNVFIQSPRKFVDATLPDRSTLSITLASDDAGDRSDCGYSTTSTEIYFGACNYESGYDHPIVSGFRFQNVPLPQNAIIKDARLEFTVAGSFTSTVHVYFYGQRSANSTTFTGTDSPRDRLNEKTNSFVSWGISEAWSAGETRRSPDLAPIVQELVRQSDWRGGNALTILADGWSTEQGQHRRVIAWERNNGAQAARLVVTYELPQALQPAVDNFVTASRQDLQDITAAAGDVCTVGDYFSDRVSQTQTELILDLIFDAVELGGVNWGRVGLGLNHITTPGYQAALHAPWRHWMDDFVARRWYHRLYDVLHNNRELLFSETMLAGFEYYATEGAFDMSKEAVRETLASYFSGGGEPFQDHICTTIASLAGETNGYLSVFARARDELLAQLTTTPLTPAQVVAYQDDLTARRAADRQMVEHLRAYRELLWRSYERSVADEENWWQEALGKLIARIIVTGAATLTWDGPGFYVANAGWGGFELLYDLATGVGTLYNEEKVLDQALRFFGGGATWLAYQQVSANTLNALGLILSGQPPQIAGGTVSPGAMRSFIHDTSSYAFEYGSEMELAIANTASFPTTFVTYASYRNSDTAQVLLFQGGTLELAGGGQGVALIKFKHQGWGDTPLPNRPVKLLVLGFTETGMYPVADLEVSWVPEYISDAVNSPRPATAGQVAPQASPPPVLPYPLALALANLPGTPEYQHLIQVANPFTATSSITVTQSIPANFEILDAGGGQVAGNTLVWNRELGPGAWLELRPRLRWEGAPGEITSMPGPELRLPDPNTGLPLVFTTPAAEVPAAWPITTAYDLRPTWPAGVTVTIPITLTNISTGAAVQGWFTSTVTAEDGSSIWSAVQPVSIAAGGTQPLTLTLVAPDQPGYAVFIGEMALGIAQQREILELVEISGSRVYLPLVTRER